MQYKKEEIPVKVGPQSIIIAFRLNSRSFYRNNINRHFEIEHSKIYFLFYKKKYYQINVLTM